MKGKRMRERIWTRGDSYANESVKVSCVEVIWYVRYCCEMTTFCLLQNSQFQGIWSCACVVMGVELGPGSLFSYICVCLWELTTFLLFFYICYCIII